VSLWLSACPAVAAVRQVWKCRPVCDAARERCTLHCVCRARWLNWRLDVLSLLVLLLAVLPFYHCYRGLATTGDYHLARLLSLPYCLASALLQFKAHLQCLAHAPSRLSSAYNTVHAPLDQPYWEAQRDDMAVI